MVVEEISPKDQSACCGLFPIFIGIKDVIILGRISTNFFAPSNSIFSSSLGYFQSICSSSAASFRWMESIFSSLVFESSNPHHRAYLSYLRSMCDLYKGTYEVDSLLLDSMLLGKSFTTVGNSTSRHSLFKYSVYCGV